MEPSVTSGENSELIINLQSIYLPPVTLVLTVFIVLGALLGNLASTSFLEWWILHPLTILPPRFW